MITVDREALKNATAAIKSLEKRAFFTPSYIAFLSCESGAFSVRGTDGDNWLSIRMECGGEPLAPIQVDAAKLAELVSKMRGDELKLDTVDGSLIIKGAKGSSRKLAGVVTVYPEPPAPEGETDTIEVDAFRDAIAFCAPSIPTSDDKATYQGVRLQGGNAVAYNGAGFVGASVAARSAVTIAAGTIKLLKWLPDGGSVEMTVGERLTGFEWDDGSLISKQLEGSWSFLAKGIDAILPDHADTLNVHPSELATAINAVKVVAADDKTSKSKVVTLALSREGCTVSVASQAGSAEEPFDAEWSGDDMRVHMSAMRLAGILSGFDADMPVLIGITALPDNDTEPKKGCVFQQDNKTGFIGMLMQMTSNGYGR